MAVTKTPFRAKHGLQSFEDSTFSKNVTITAGSLTITAGNITASGTATVGKVVQTGTSSMVIPRGTTAQRDNVPTEGSFRANSETHNFEGYIDNSWVILGGTTSLKTGAYQNIELIAAAAGLGHEVIAGDTGVRVYRDVVALASASATVTGAIVFKLPPFVAPNTLNTMVRMRFVGQHLNGNQMSFELDVGGYWYGTGPSWTQLRCVSKGVSPVTQVRGGLDADGSPVIIIGTDATVWNYPRIVLEMLEVSYTGVNRPWYQGWTATTSNTTSAYTSQTTAVLEQVYTTSNFDPTLKYDKTGGAISGPVSMGGTLSVAGTATLSGGAAAPGYAATGSLAANYEAQGAFQKGGFLVTNAVIAGGFGAWNTTRATSLQVDCPGNGSAYSMLRATNWGERHLFGLDVYSGGSSSSVPQAVFHVGATSNAFTFDGSGNFVAVGNVTAYSDKRLKKDLVQIEGALDKIDKLTGYTYTRIDTGERQTGLIAQDVHDVLPEAVSVMDNLESTLGVSYGNMMGLVVEALKELRAEIEELKRGK